MSQTISSLVKSQFPEFVQEDYPALIAFIEAYYQYLELEKNPQDILTNLIAYSDIDRTLDEFVSKFEKTYLNGLPLNVAGDKRMFMKHVNDLYNTKGTEESFRLLFRLLFNEEIEIYYPKQQMLRASSGVWVQNNSIMISLDAGISTDCINKTIKIYTTAGVINTFVKDFVQRDTGVYELFIDKTFGIGIQPGDRILGLNFSATVLPTVVSGDVTTPGSGFHIGQVFTVTSVNGQDAKIKVTRVDANGGISRIAFIQFGTGFVSDFMLSISPTVRKAGPLDPYSSYTNGFIEDVIVTKATYFISDYVDITYSGQVIGSSYTDDYQPDNAQAAVVNPAAIQFHLGALCVYRGEYTTADGFLSDVNVIQDGYLYQDFSYVIKSQQKIQDYANVVKKLCHPAGTLMFGELSLETQIDVGVTYGYFKVLTEQLKFLDSVTSSDVITVTSGSGISDASTSNDSILAFATGKGLTDATSPTLDAIALTTGKGLTDATAGSVDAIALTTGKGLADSSPPDDSLLSFATSKPLTDGSPPDDSLISLTTGKALTDTTLGSIDAIALTTGKGLSDTSTSGDAAIAFETDKGLTDASTSNDSTLSLTTLKALIDASTSDDSLIALNTTRNDVGNDVVTPSDFLSALYVNYADGTYFAEAYVGTILTTS